MTSYIYDLPEFNLIIKEGLAKCRYIHWGCYGRTERRYRLLFKEYAYRLIKPLVTGGGTGLLHLLIKTLETKEPGHIAIT